MRTPERMAFIYLSTSSRLPVSVTFTTAGACKASVSTNSTTSAYSFVKSKYLIKGNVIDSIVLRPLCKDYTA